MRAGRNLGELGGAWESLGGSWEGPGRSLGDSGIFWEEPGSAGRNLGELGGAWEDQGGASESLGEVWEILGEPFRLCLQNSVECHWIVSPAELNVCVGNAKFIEIIRIPLDDEPI